MHPHIESVPDIFRIQLYTQQRYFFTWEAYLFAKHTPEDNEL